MSVAEIAGRCGRVSRFDPAFIGLAGPHKYASFDNRSLTRNGQAVAAESLHSEARASAVCTEEDKLKHVPTRGQAKACPTVLAGQMSEAQTYTR